MATAWATLGPDDIFKPWLGSHGRGSGSGPELLSDVSHSLGEELPGDGIGEFENLVGIALGQQTATKAAGIAKLHHQVAGEGVLHTAVESNGVRGLQVRVDGGIEGQAILQTERYAVGREGLVRRFGRSGRDDVNGGDAVLAVEPRTGSDGIVRVARDSQRGGAGLLEEIGIRVLNVLNRGDDGAVIDDADAAVEDGLLVPAGVEREAKTRSEEMVLGLIQWRPINGLAAKNVADQRDGSGTRERSIALGDASAKYLS